MAQSRFPVIQSAVRSPVRGVGGAPHYTQPPPLFIVANAIQDRKKKTRWQHGRISGWWVRRRAGRGIARTETRTQKKKTKKKKKKYQNKPPRGGGGGYGAGAAQGVVAARTMRPRIGEGSRAICFSKLCSNWEPSV